MSCPSRMGTRPGRAAPVRGWQAGKPESNRAALPARPCVPWTKHPCASLNCRWHLTAVDGTSQYEAVAARSGRSIRRRRHRHRGVPPVLASTRAIALTSLPGMVYEVSHWRFHRMNGNIRIHDLPAQDRPRERLAAHGADSLSHAELLAILLRTGTRGMSALPTGQHFMLKFGTPSHVARASL